MLSLCSNFFIIYNGFRSFSIKVNAYKRNFENMA